MNLMLMTDSYKAGHSKCYPEKIQRVYSYFESRGGIYPTALFFGLQYYLKKYLDGVRITLGDVIEAEKFWKEHFGRDDYFHREGWEYIATKLDGKLPIEIKAVPEGTVVPVSNVLMTLENTDENCAWLTNYLETLLVKVWYATTIATQSYYIKKSIVEFLEKSGDPAGANFKVHDFGYRGCSSEETSEIGAAAHLVSFMGTDTVSGIRLLKEYYQAGMCGFSIPATEHSIMCSFGRENEVDACNNFLNKFPKGLIACVSDTYNIYNCCENIWGGFLRNKVLARDGCLVVRPDSGDYFEVVPRVLSILADKFGASVNAKGFRVLDPHVRVIQGDGMNPETIRKLYQHIMNLGWSADNLAVGSGGGLLQQVNRDTMRFAFKCSAVKSDNQWIDVCKEPITDPGKKSKRGRLKLIQLRGSHGDGIATVGETADGTDLLQTVFKNGEIVRNYSLDSIKKNVENKLFTYEPTAQV